MYVVLARKKRSSVWSVDGSGTVYKEKKQAETAAETLRKLIPDAKVSVCWVDPE